MTLPLGASHDPVAERAVLAACVESATARASARKHLTAEDFGDPRHADVWAAMARLERHGKHVDPFTLLAVVAPASKPLLADIATTQALPDHVGDYAEIVRGWAIRRRLWREATVTGAPSGPCPGRRRRDERTSRASHSRATSRVKPWGD